MVLNRIAAAVLLATPAIAQVGDPQIRTDHTYYPGELAMSTPARAVDFAFSQDRPPLGDSDRDRFIKLFLWRSEHYSHLHSPMIYTLPGSVPDPHSAYQLTIDYDAMRSMFSYGWGLCGTNHGQMRVFADAAGWPLRRRHFWTDTGCEMFVDGAWRYFNVDQYTLHFLTDDPDSHFASVDDVLNNEHRFVEWNPDLGLGYRLPQANTHGYYRDVDGLTGLVLNRASQWAAYWGWVWDTPASQSHKMYHEGYTATPIGYTLKRGESFTRWYDPDGVVQDLGLEGRIWWGFNTGTEGDMGKGPYARWSFVQNAPARDEIPGLPEESESWQRYGNGAYQWTPDLSRGEHEDGLFEENGTFVKGASAVEAVGEGSLVFAHYTPYTIAARPLETNDNGHPDPAFDARDGALLTASVEGEIPVLVSVNSGATWKTVGELRDDTRLDFTNHVKGRNQYLVKLEFDDGEGLDALSLRTIVNVAWGVYPNLRDGGTRVSYETFAQGAIDLSPDLNTPESTLSTGSYARLVETSDNVKFTHYVGGPKMALESTDLEPIWITYRVDLPTALAERGATLRRIQMAMDASVFTNPTPPDNESRIEIGTSRSGPWTEIARNSVPVENKLSHYWTYGATSDDEPFGGTTAFIRVHHDDGPWLARIRFLRFFATYDLPTTSDLEIAYHWYDGAERSFSHTIPAGTETDSWRVPTGDGVEQRKVVFRTLPEPGENVCFGDGSGASCPCGNDSTIPGTGCLHGGGKGMSLSASGSTSLSADDLVMTVHDAPVGNRGLFLAGQALLAGLPMRDGLLCAGGGRLKFRGLVSRGGMARDSGFVSQDELGFFWAPGQTYVFQYVSRDRNSPCGGNANLSSAYSVTMTP